MWWGHKAWHGGCGKGGQNNLTRSQEPVLVRVLVFVVLPKGLLSVTTTHMLVECLTMPGRLVKERHGRDTKQ